MFLILFVCKVGKYLLLIYSSVKLVFRLRVFPTYFILLNVEISEEIFNENFMCDPFTIVKF